MTSSHQRNIFFRKRDKSYRKCREKFEYSYHVEGVVSWAKGTGCPGFWHFLVFAGGPRKNYGARDKVFAAKNLFMANALTCSTLIAWKVRLETSLALYKKSSI